MTVKTHSFFMKLFISFALLVIIPVIVIYGISTRQTIINSENAIGQNCVDNLKTADKGIQQMKASLYKDAVSLSRDYSVTNMANYLNIKKNFTGEEMINMSHVLDTLIKMVQNDNNYYSIYLYLDNFNHTFTSDKNLVPNDKLADTGWMKYYSDYKTKMIPLSFANTRLLDKRNNNSMDSWVYVTTYIYPLTPYTTSLDGAIVINVKESAINKMINSNAASTDGSILIMNSTGEVVSDVNNSNLCKNIADLGYISSILKSDKASGFFFGMVGISNSLVSYYKSEFNDWIYVGVNPLNSLVNNQREINKNTVIITIAIIVLGIVVAFVVSRKIYDPVNMMVKTIKSKQLVSMMENEDEMSIIYNALNSINKKSNSQELDKKKHQENCIIRLLGDELPDEDDKSVLAETFIYDSFICIVISVDRYNEVMERYEAKQWRYMKSFLLELSNEIISRNNIHIGCSIKKGEIFLVCNVNNTQSIHCQQQLQVSFQDFQKEVTKALDNTITIGIGSCHTDIMGIRDSYIEAEIAMKQKLKLGLGNIIVWNEDLNVSAYYYPVTVEEQIRNYLDLEMKQELTAKVGELIENLKVRKGLSSENIIQIITQLVGNTIIKYMIEHHINFDDVYVYGGNTNIYTEVFRKETLDSIKDILIEKYTQLLDYSMMAKNRKNTVDRMVEYIQDNYRRDIGISEISEYIGMSYSHVRKIFKMEVGQSIVDYINSMRIKEAKALLLGKELSIKNIAATLGYNNDQSFERYFKKIVGITPGEFRSRK
jgi:two-component system, response regulator YesN